MRHSTKALFARLFSGLSIAPLGGRLRSWPSSAPRDQTPRLHRQFLPSGAASGEVAMHQRRQSQSCNSASGSRACDGAHDRDGAPRRRSRDRLADLADRRGIAMHQATRITDIRAGGKGRRPEKRLAGLHCNASARHAIPRHSSKQDIQRFDVWLNDAQQSGIYAIHRFARTLRRDVDAVRNSLTEGWSNGQTEGQINRLKTLKRAMYGRASTELLRARMLPLHLPIQHGK